MSNEQRHEEERWKQRQLSRNDVAARLLELAKWPDVLEIRGMQSALLDAAKALVSEKEPMSNDEHIAYRWALDNNFTSVAADNAKMLARYIKRCHERNSK